MNVFDESFEQPIFGANYIFVKCNPVSSGGITGPSEIKLIFNSGGCNNFLPRFAKLMEVVHSTRNQSFSTISPSIKQTYNSYSFATQPTAISDPSDPTTVYVSLPPSAVKANNIPQNYPHPNFVPSEPSYMPPQQQYPQPQQPYSQPQQQYSQPQQQYPQPNTQYQYQQPPAQYQQYQPQQYPVSTQYEPPPPIYQQQQPMTYQYQPQPPIGVDFNTPPSGYPPPQQYPGGSSQPQQYNPTVVELPTNGGNYHPSQSNTQTQQENPFFKSY